MVQRSRPASVGRDYTVSSRTNIWISTKPYTQLIFPVVRQRKTDCLGYRILFPRDVFSNWFGCYWWFCKFGQNEVERSKVKVVTRPGQKGGGTTTVEFYLVNVFSQSIIQHFLTLLVNKSADILQPRCQAWGMRVKPPKCCLPPSWNILVKNQEVKCSKNSFWSFLPSKSVEKCLQTVSASGGLHRISQTPYRGFAP